MTLEQDLQTKPIGVGDTVTLKSGGPRMTVVDFYSDDTDTGKLAVCVWFKDGEESRATYPVAALTEDNPQNLIISMQESAERAKNRTLDEI